MHYSNWKLGERMGNLRVLVWILGSGALATAQEPSLQVVIPERDARIGQPYALSYEVSWRGDARDFAVMPPEFESIEWGNVVVREAVSELRRDTFTITQAVEIIPQEVGEFEWPAVTIGYPNPEAAPPLGSENSEANPSELGVYPTLRAQSLPILVRSPSIVPWISGCLGAFFALSIFVTLLVYNSRMRSVAVAADAPSDGQSVQEILHRARRHRLDGRYYEYFTALVGAAESAGEESHADLLKRLKSRTHEVGFGGVRPTEDELDGVFRDVERAVSGRLESKGPDRESHG
jgi:hypothetical protein